MRPTVLVATWQGGVHVFAENERTHELAGHSVRRLTTDGRGGALAIVDGRTLRRRSVDGSWSVLATVECAPSCCVASRDAIYVGTDTARVFRLDAEQTLAELHGFERVQGREAWYAGQALVDGRLMGPPLGVRSIAATLDGTLLANVHVGGIPRSTDGGTGWQPTIDIDADVHEVCAHPSRAGVVIAAAAVGLCTSRDGGATWTVQHEGLHAQYCLAVAFVGDDALISSSDGHFATQGRIYRRAIDGKGPLRPLTGDLPEWTDGIVDTHCIGASGSHVAFADRGGNVWVSRDAGLAWSRVAHR